MSDVKTTLRELLSNAVKLLPRELQTAWLGFVMIKDKTWLTFCYTEGAKGDGCAAERRERLQKKGGS